MYRLAELLELMKPQVKKPGKKKKEVKK